MARINCPENYNHIKELQKYWPIRQEALKKIKGKLSEEDSLTNIMEIANNYNKVDDALHDLSQYDLNALFQQNPTGSFDPTGSFGLAILLFIYSQLPNEELDPNDNCVKALYNEAKVICTLTEDTSHVPDSSILYTIKEHTGIGIEVIGDEALISYI